VVSLNFNILTLQQLNRQCHWSLFSTYWRYTNKIIINIIIIKEIVERQTKRAQSCAGAAGLSFSQNVCCVTHYCYSEW